MQGRLLTRRRTVQLGVVAGSAVMARGARAAAPVQLISHRYPALEFWASKMKTAVPGVEVNAQLMPFDKALELATISLSSKADTLDLVYASDSTVQTFAKNGWVRPLNDLWARYRQEFKLDDYADEVMKLFTRDSNIYVIPAGINVMMLFYRNDLFEAAGKKVPTTVAEYQDLTRSFNTPMRAGTISCLKPVDACLNEAHWYMNTIGPGWFDSSWKPISTPMPAFGRSTPCGTRHAPRNAGSPPPQTTNVRLPCSRTSRRWVCSRRHGRIPWTTRSSRTLLARLPGRFRRRGTDGSARMAMRSRPSVSRTRTPCSVSSRRRRRSRTCVRDRR